MIFYKYAGEKRVFEFYIQSFSINIMKKLVIFY